MGAAKACLVLARKLREGSWLPADEKRAAALESRGQDLRAPSKVRALLERGCDSEIFTDCYLLGMAYLKGKPAWNVKKDQERGAALITRACEEGDSLDAECRVANSLNWEARKPASNDTTACDNFERSP